MKSPKDKIRDMKEKKFGLGWPSGYSDSEKIAKENAKPSTLSRRELDRATKIINTRRGLDQGKAIARAEGSVKRAAKKASANRLAKAVAGGTTKTVKKAAAKKAVAKKTSPKKYK